MYGRLFSAVKHREIRELVNGNAKLSVIGKTVKNCCCGHKQHAVMKAFIAVGKKVKEMVVQKLDFIIQQTLRGVQARSLQLNHLGLSFEC